MPVYLLSDDTTFPPPQLAVKEGLLAVGGDLSVKRLLSAYRMGIFPWFSEQDPILWWSPDPRLVLFPNQLVVSKSLKKTIKKNRFRITLDSAFEQVIEACSGIPRRHEQGTWITTGMIAAYIELHRAGYAHSVEAWQQGELAGGLYGVSLGRCFFGESMFTRISNASKVAFVALVSYLRKHSFDLIDCQVSTGHMKRFGAREIARRRFLAVLAASLESATLKGKWSFSQLPN